MTTIQGKEIAEVYDKKNPDWTFFSEAWWQSLVVKSMDSGARPLKFEVGLSCLLIMWT